MNFALGDIPSQHETVTFAAPNRDASSDSGNPLQLMECSSALAPPSSHSSLELLHCTAGKTDYAGAGLGVLLLAACPAGHYRVPPALGEQKESKRSTSPRAVFGTSTRDDAVPKASGADTCYSRAMTRSLVNYSSRVGM